MKSMIIAMVKDVKAGEFIGQPMFFDDEFQSAQAMKAFEAQFNKLQKHDFQMYKVGEFDKESDSIIKGCEPELLAKYVDEDFEE